MEHTEEQLENMSLEQLRELALSTGAQAVEAPAPAAPATEPVETPRDAQGRFISPEPVAPVADAEPLEDEPVLYRREIDLGDGSGTQVFEGETLEELVDKLADAQKHATRKIRDLNRQAKEVAAPPAPKPLTPDEEYLVSQQLQSNPSKAFELLF